jgi:gentisate 1,2-dioxygenase
MDILDVPTVPLLNPMFFEHHEEGLEAITGTNPASPFRFAFADIKQRLDAAPEIEPGLRRIELEAPAGSAAMVTIALHVARIAPGAALKLPAMTSSIIMAVMAGRCEVDTGSEKFTGLRGDAIALPAGKDYVVRATDEAYVLTATDEPLMKALGWLRPVPAALKS